MDVVSVLGFVLLGVVVAALGTIIGAGGGLILCQYFFTSFQNGRQLWW